MLTQIAVNRTTGHGKYGDILDVAESLAACDYGTATNALVAMVRQSPLYKKALMKLRKQKPRTTR